MANACEICGANLAMVGKMHRCLPRVLAHPVIVRDAVAGSAPDLDRAEAALPEISAAPRHEAVPSSTYRYRDPERRREQQRDLMRRRRAEGKA